jgi:hypothetical protein
MQRFFIIFFLLFACQAEPQKSSEKNTAQKQVRTPSKKGLKPQMKPGNIHAFEITTLQSASGWGYQIRQNGKLVIEEENNQTVKIQGREWYILVVQPTNDNDCSIDPMGFGYDDGAFMVSGFIYHFTRKENRDAIYKYVMKK